MTDPSRSVLIVSDDPKFRDEIVYAFPQGVTVSVARDAREAWSLMQVRAPHVVCLDIQSGSSGGFGLSRDMDSIKELREVPRLILIKRPQDAWLARQAGATAYRVMPVESGELAATIVSMGDATSPS